MFDFRCAGRELFPAAALAFLNEPGREQVQKLRVAGLQKVQEEILGHDFHSPITGHRPRGFVSSRDSFGLL